jgi:hypothetical protein
MDRGGLAKRLLSSGRLSGRGSGRVSLRLVAASAVLGTRARARARAVLPVQALVSSSSGSSGSFSATRSFSTAPGSGSISTGTPPLHRDTRHVTSACDPHTRALVPPLHLSTTYERDEPEQPTALGQGIKSPYTFRSSVWLRWRVCARGSAP